MTQLSMSALAKQLSHLTVLQVVELVKTLEEEWGVTAAQPVVQPIQRIDPVIPVSNTLDVVLTDYGANKIKVIKEVRAALRFGLKEAKGFVDQVPVVLQTEMLREEAEALQARLEAVGATVELK